MPFKVTSRAEFHRRVTHLWNAGSRPVVSSGHFLDSWGSGDRHMTSLQKHMKSRPVIPGKLKFRIWNLSIRLKKKSLFGTVVCCLFTSLFVWMVLMWNIPSSHADPTWKSPICSVSSQSWMVATATDAAVVMLQYEQPIRTGHFLIKRKTTTTDTEDYSRFTIGLLWTPPPQWEASFVTNWTPSV